VLHVRAVLADTFTPYRPRRERDGVSRGRIAVYPRTRTCENEKENKMSRDETPWIEGIDDEIGRWVHETAASGEDAQRAARQLVARLREKYPDQYREWVDLRAWRLLSEHLVAARKKIAAAQARGR
jgi:hypothetical protein